MFSASLLKEIQEKKKLLSEKIKQVKIDPQELINRIQNPSVKIENQRVKITEDQFICLVRIAKSIVYKQQSLLKIQAPIYVATGTLGNYHQLSLIFEKCGNPQFVNYLFLGDYTGKYNRGIQCLVALLIYKIKYPYNFFLLRGCFQTVSISRTYHLYEQIIEFFGSNRSWAQVCQLFCCLSFAATINNQIFCVHGGISQFLYSLQQINLIYKPLDVPKKGLPNDLIFSTASYEADDIEENLVQCIYGQRQVSNFLKRTNMRLIVKGHQILSKGFEYVFDKKLVKLCSLSNVSNFYNNASAVMMVDDQNNVIFRQINSQILLKAQQQNQQGLTFQQIIQMRQQKKSRMEELLKKQEQKRKQQQCKKQKNQLQKQKKQQKKKLKEQRKKLQRLKQQMIKQRQEKNNKLNQTTQQLSLKETEQKNQLQNSHNNQEQ